MNSIIPMKNVFLIIASFVVSAAFAGPGDIATVSNADYTCDPSNRLILVTAGTAPVNITLPAAIAYGQMINVVVQNGTFAVTVKKTGTDVLVDPAGGAYMGGGSCAAGEAVTVTSAGNGTWYVTSSRNNGCANWQSSPAGGNTIPTGTAAGQMLYWNGTKWKTLATGTSSQVLMGGTAPAWTTPNGSNLLGIPSGMIVMFPTAGIYNGFSYLGYSELKVAGDVWSTKTAIPTGRAGIVAAGVNGRVYAIGGQNGGFSTSTDEYDPVGNSWASKTAMPTPRGWHSAVPVNGKIYCAGGANGAIALNVNEAYDVVANTWATKAVMPTPRFEFASSAVNGVVYVAGGANTSVVLNANEAYDPGTDAWTTKSNVGFTPRQFVPGATYNGKMYVIGGWTGSAALTTNEAYDPSTDSWSTKSGAGFTARANHAAVTLNGRIYTLAGYKGGYMKNNEEYDPVNDSWTTRSNTGLTARSDLAAAAVNGKLYVLGGLNVVAQNLNEEYTAPLTVYYFIRD
jgi:N-acetylneuraminic acid mutarotase